MTHKLSILLVEDEKNICDFISTSPFYQRRVRGERVPKQ